MALLLWSILKYTMAASIEVLKHRRPLSAGRNMCASRDSSERIKLKRGPEKLGSFETSDRENLGPALRFVLNNSNFIQINLYRHFR